MWGIYQRSGAFVGILEEFLAAAAKIIFGFVHKTFFFENMLLPISCACVIICSGVHPRESFCTSTGFVRAKILQICFDGIQGFPVFRFLYCVMEACRFDYTYFSTECSGSARSCVLFQFRILIYSRIRNRTRNFYFGCPW